MSVSVILIFSGGASIVEDYMIGRGWEYNWMWCEPVRVTVVGRLWRSLVLMRWRQLVRDRTTSARTWYIAPTGNSSHCEHSDVQISFSVFTLRGHEEVWLGQLEGRLDENRDFTLVSHPSFRNPHFYTDYIGMINAPALKKEPISPVTNLFHGARHFILLSSILTSLRLLENVGKSGSAL